MENEVNNEVATHGGSVEYRKGCPACEHNDPELERELQTFAQLLLDIYLAKRSKARQPDVGTGIDNAP
jgi:hypothetical protein